MYFLFVFLPLTSFLISFLFSGVFGKKGIAYICTFFLFSSACISLFIFYEIVLFDSNCYFSLFPWIESGTLSIEWSCFFDQLTAIMCVMISIVSFCVHYFSINYMAADFQQEKFMGLLSLFTFFMLMLIVSDNLLQLILGWEGVGLCSYLLINFWYMRKNTNDAALKAVFFNRFGDLCLLFAIFLIFYYLKTLNFLIIFDNYQVLLNQKINFLFFSLNILELICFFFTIGAMAKSAQIFLQGWLGDAMEGPTPVSALIHAATMVTAGIYLLMRFSVLFSNAKTVLFIVLICGALTTLFCSLIGVDSCDLKKIIASSTASQLGYMFYTCGLTEFSASLCHLFFHAFFKALLFLSAGAIIHSLCDEQDVRKMGGLLQKLPLIFLSMMIGSFALVGMPFIGGFYSKDPLLEYSDLMLYVEELMTLFAATLGAFNTSFYSARLLHLVFLGDFKGQKIVFTNFHFPSAFLVIPLLILIFFTFFSYITFDIFVSEGSNLFLFSGVNIFLFKESDEDLDTFLLIFFFIFLGIFSYNNEIFFDFFFNLSYNSRNHSSFLSNVDDFEFFEILKDYNVAKWFFDLFFIKYLVSLFINVSENLFLVFDRGIFDLYGSAFLFNFFSKISLVASLEQSGFIYHYVLYQCVWIILSFFTLNINIYLFEI